MKVLGIDCSTGWTGVGLFSDGAVTVDINYFAGRKQSSLLPVLVEDTLERTALAPALLDAVAVTVGPGSFTGIKVGLSYACALAEGAGKKVVPISSLLALGAPFLDDMRLLIPLIRARRDQVYYSALKGKIRSPFFISPPGILSVGDLAEITGHLPTPFIVADEDPHLLKELAKSGIRVPTSASIRGGIVAFLGTVLFAEAVWPEEARAVYIRMTDAGVAGK